MFVFKNMDIVTSFLKNIVLYFMMRYFAWSYVVSGTKLADLYL